MKCKYCGKRFVKAHIAQKYCSRLCARKGVAKKCDAESRNGTICWTCRNTNDSCAWFSENGKPVDGWKAKKVKYKMSNGEYADSYIVKKCPNYEQERN